MNEDLRGVADDLKEALTPVFEKMKGRLTAVYLFGSLANGDATPTSDMDLAALLPSGDPKAALDVKIDLYTECSRALRRNDIDIVIINQTRNLFILDSIVCDGIVLYEEDRELREEFEVKIHHDFINFRDQRKRLTGI